YARAGEIDASVAPVQGSRSRSVRPDCLAPEFAAGAAPAPDVEPCLDPVSALQARDVVSAKIPRAMRYADGVSMMHSRELREPFLDHRIMELGLRQPAERKIANGHGKHMVRRLAGRLIPEGASSAPKRPVQTPQREWLPGGLREGAMEHCETALS